MTVHRKLCVLMIGCLVSVAAAGPATAPADLEEKVAALLKQLDSDSYQERETASLAAGQLPSEALPLFETAGKKPDASPELRTQIASIVKTLERVAGKQSRYQQALEFYRSQLYGQYEKLGKKNPAWDAPAKSFLEASARQRANELMGYDKSIDAKTSYAPLREAKCDDLLVTFTNSTFHNMSPNVKAGTPDPLTVLLASELSSYVKIQALAQRSKTRQRFPNMEPRGEKPLPFVKQAMELWPSALKENPAIPPAIVIKEVLALLDEAKKLGMERKAAWDLIDASLAKALPEESLVRLNVKGRFLIDYAWDARGGGWANSVTPDGWKHFNERLGDAEKTLTRCYELFPDDPHAATQMLTVELGQGQGRQRLEQWFDRAMKADPGNTEACTAKMWYIAPRWHGSLQEQLQFGRQCLAAGQFDSKVPLMVVDAHASMETPAPWASDVPVPFYAQKDVWSDISAAYEGYIEQHPDAWERRERYAHYTWRAGKMKESVAQLAALEAAIPEFQRKHLYRVMQAKLNMPARADDPKVAATARARKDTDDLKRVMVEAYDQVGKKDAKWDADAKAALLAAAKDWGDDLDRDFSERDVAFESARKAIEAGCDDPLVRFVYSYTTDTYVSEPHPKSRPKSFFDAVALARSNYGAFVRLRALAWVCKADVQRKFANPKDREEFRAALKEAVPLFKLAAGERSVRERVLQIDISAILRCHLAVGENSAEVIAMAQKELEGSQIEPAIMRAIAARAISDRRVITGSFRNPNNINHRSPTTKETLITTAQAREWENLWMENPTDPYVLQMIVSMLRNSPETGRQWLDFWIYEAIRSDPSSYAIAREAIEQLRWAELSFEDIQEFAERCAATGDYRSQIPFVLVERIENYARREPENIDGKPDGDVLAQPEYWGEIAGVYEAYLTRFPLDTGRRSEYASLACLTGHWPLAAQQFKLLGNRVKPKAFYTQERLNACRGKIETLMGKGFLPAVEP